MYFECDFQLVWRKRFHVGLGGQGTPFCVVNSRFWRFLPARILAGYNFAIFYLAGI